MPTIIKVIIWGIIFATITTIYDYKKGKKRVLDDCKKILNKLQ